MQHTLSWQREIPEDTIFCVNFPILITGTKHALFLSLIQILVFLLRCHQDLTPLPPRSSHQQPVTLQLMHKILYNIFAARIFIIYSYDHFFPSSSLLLNCSPSRDVGRVIARLHLVVFFNSLPPPMRSMSYATIIQFIPNARNLITIIS